jgi:phosphoribosylanthranilate isomerase
MRTRVKICGITREDDGRAAAAAGADAIGLVFWPGTPRRVTIAQARAIVAALPPFVAKVGLFVDPSRDEVDAALAGVALDALQFHGHEEPAFCRSFGRPYLKAIPVKEGVDLLESVSQFGDAAGLLFDAYRPGDLPGGTGHGFDWSRLTAGLRARMRPPLVLSGGLDPGNVERAVREVRRGLKDAARIAAFMQGVRSADA